MAVIAVRKFDINCIPVGSDYLGTMGIELVKGRNFLDGDLNKACLINEEALKQFGWDSFEGQKFNIGQEGGYNVVGIINDFKFESYHSTVEPLALLFDGATGGNVLSVRAPGQCRATDRPDTGNVENNCSVRTHEFDVLR